MTEESNPRRRPIRKGGRPRKADKAAHRHSVRLTDEENVRFERMFEQSGLTERSRYLKAAIFKTPLKVVKVDKAAMDYYIRLTNFYHQYRLIGNNYNQTTKAIKANFGEKRGLQMLYRLEKATLELVSVSKQIVELTRDLACEAEAMTHRRSNFSQNARAGILSGADIRLVVYGRIYGFPKP